MMRVNSNTCKKSNIINRELSWLEFNSRVLDQSMRDDYPFFERMKFLSIFSSNLDEFFMVRVASLGDQVRARYNKADVSGYTPRQQIETICEKTEVLVKRQYSIFRECIIPGLAENGVELLSPSEWTEEQHEFVKSYFNEMVYPVLTPLAVDPSRPFPLLQCRSLNLGILIEAPEVQEPLFCTVQIPSKMRRSVALPGKNKFALLEDIVRSNIDMLFIGKKVLSCCAYRITRNADLDISEEDAQDLLAEIQKSIKARKWGRVIRLEIEHTGSPALEKFLIDALKVKQNEVFHINGPLNLDFMLKEIYPLRGFESERFRNFEPRLPKELGLGTSMFAAIGRRDILLHHPYDSFEPVINFIMEAAADPDVLAIKQTLYRVGGNSPIIKALQYAAESGKQVTVLLEIKARFDEENNIHWGKALERAGCHVIYGLIGLKTHSKITLVVRKEGEAIKRYLHLGTGNYNDETARLYTDFGLFTANTEMGIDATAFFNMLSGFSAPPDLKVLTAAPLSLRQRLLQMIEREANNARTGLPCGIYAKMNSLVDPEVIQALYDASKAGVPIRLMVRGICCLKPGVPELSDTIEVRSIIGRFLEHSRAYWFMAGGRPELYLSSADWMPRNLDRRVELLFLVSDEAIRARVSEILERYWQDNVQVYKLNPDGSYTHLHNNGKDIYNVQQMLLSRRRG